MYSDYCESNSDIHIGYNRYYTNFITDHNLKFKLPTTDICNTCYLLNNQINLSNTTTKQSLTTDLKLHLSNGNRFYDLLKEAKIKSDPYFLCVTFEMQKILDLPKTPMNLSYYSRKINFYNFGVTEIQSTKQINSFFVWTEYDGTRGSDEIMSMLLKFITNKTKLIQLIPFSFSAIRAWAK